MTQHEFYQHLAEQTGDEYETIENIGFQLETFLYDIDRQDEKRRRSVRQHKQIRRNRHFANIAFKIQNEI